MDLHVFEELASLKAIAKRFNQKSLEQLDRISSFASAPFVLRLAGPASRSADPLNARAEPLLQRLRDQLPGDVEWAQFHDDSTEPEDSGSQRDWREERRSESTQGALVVETLRNLTHERLTAISDLARHDEPVLVVLVVFPPQPPAAQTAIMQHNRAQLRAVGIPQLFLGVWDPEEPSTLSDVAEQAARELTTDRNRRLRRLISDVHRGLLIDLRAAREVYGLDLAMLNARTRQLRFEKERVETRLSRALREFRHQVMLETPRLARPMIDAFRERAGELASAAIAGNKPFARAIRQVADDVRNDLLHSALRQIMARALEACAREACQFAADLAGPGSSETSPLGSMAGDLAADLESTLSADQLLPLIRWLDVLNDILDFAGLLETSPELIGLTLALEGLSQAYVQQKIHEAAEQSREPLRRALTKLAKTLADRAQIVITEVFDPPIQALEVALAAEKQRLHHAARPKISRDELTKAILRLEQTSERLYP